MSINILYPVALTASGAVGTSVVTGMIRSFQSAGVHNPGNDPVEFSMHLVPKDAEAIPNNRIIKRTVPAGKTDLCNELIGRSLDEGGTLVMSGVGLTFGYTAIDTLI